MKATETVSNNDDESNDKNKSNPLNVKLTVSMYSFKIIDR